MTSRADRKELFETRLGARLRGLAKDPCLTAFLDAMDRADEEGLNQMVEALLAEIRRSGHGAGFLLELLVAIALFPTPAPRHLRCEQQEGLAKAPGDIWLDWKSRRYEFQCKHIMNWSVELWMAAATDRIERELASIAPGRFYDLDPGIEGTEQDWKDFAQWVIDNYVGWQDGIQNDFRVGGRYVGSITLNHAPGKGLRTRVSMSPGGVQRMDTDFLKKKLGSALSKARESLSAGPAAGHLNCLVIDIANWIVDKEDVFHALYGREAFRMGMNVPPKVDFEWNGLFYTDNRWEILSAVVWPRLSGCSPLSVDVTVFPNPKYLQDVVDAFTGMTGFSVVQSTKDVER